MIPTFDIELRVVHFKFIEGRMDTRNICAIRSGRTFIQGRLFEGMLQCPDDS